MGVQCSKATDHQVFSLELSRRKSLQAEMRRSKDFCTFQIEISHLKFYKLPQTFQNLIFQLEDHFSIIVPYSDFIKEAESLVSKSIYRSKIKVSIQIVARLEIWVLLENNGERKKMLKIGLHQLLQGPSKHDHLLTDCDSRLLFHLQIQQYLPLQLHLQSTFTSQSNIELLANSTLSLSLILSKSRPCASALLDFANNKKTKELSLQKVTILNSELKEATIKISITDNINNQNYVECYIPYSQLQQTGGYKSVIRGQTNFEQRELTLNQKICQENGEVGQVTWNLRFLNAKLYAEQLECVVLSEKGIIMHSQRQIEINELNQDKQLPISILVDNYNQLQVFRQHGVSQFKLFLFLQQFQIQIYEKQVKLTDELPKNQQLLLNLLAILAEFLTYNKSMQNESIWNLINSLCRQNILQLKYYYLVPSESKRRSFAKKFDLFIIIALKKIIQISTENVLIKEKKCMHKFYAFAYFRFPWCQEEIVNVLRNSEDPFISQDKLSEIGANSALKTPQKSCFYDWQTSVLKQIEQNKKHSLRLNQLQEMKKVHNKWSEFLFNRQNETLFYSIYSEIFSEGQVFLLNEEKVMWEYFPKYGDLLSIFFGEINKAAITDFSEEMTKCNVKLIKNVKLLNTFMMLIFPKTHLYEVYCVVKCLDLIQCYFDTVQTHSKTLPNDFNYSYFWTAIKCVFELQSTHSLLLEKCIAILYKYYNMFTLDFKFQLNNYILRKCFYSFFLHWSRGVRNMFHLYLIFKILTPKRSNNFENQLKKQKNGEQFLHIKIQFENIIEALYQKKEQLKHTSIDTNISVQNEYVFKMKAKIKARMLFKGKRQQRTPKKSIKFVEMNTESKSSILHSSPILTKRKWSTVVKSNDQKGPTKQQLRYLTISLHQFELAKKQLQPDVKVCLRCKALHIDKDE